MSEEALLVYVSCPADAAERIATALVERRVAACVNVLPGVRSIYRWKNQVQRDDEVLLLIKTAATRFEALKAAVLAEHPYELPEVIAVKLDACHPPYLDWVLENSR